MKLRLLILIFCMFSFISNAQFTADAFVSKGIALHDSGEYEKAIEAYKKALAIEPKSALINYEIALSYYAMGKYKKSIKYSNKVLKGDSPHRLSAYVAKGNSLDMLGKTKQSIKVYNEGIMQTGGHYLLCYNLAINYYKKNDNDNAEKNAIAAIDNNLNHGSSHLMLANINYAKSNKVKAILASHFFLLLEPDSYRSSEAYEILVNSFNNNVSQNKDDSNSINIVLSEGTMSKEFGMHEMMVSLMTASNMSEENQGKSQTELFIENNESLFKMLCEDEAKSNIWYDLYIDFYKDLVESEHFKTYMHFIQQSFNEESKEWLKQNESKVDAFRNWMNQD